MQPEENLSEPTKHRSVDENGNPDDKLTEQEALAQAADEGIYFVDDYIITNIETMESIDGSFATKEEAENAIFEMEDSQKYTVSQRRQKAS